LARVTNNPGPSWAGINYKIPKRRSGGLVEPVPRAVKPTPICAEENISLPDLGEKRRYPCQS